MPFWFGALIVLPGPPNTCSLALEKFRSLGVQFISYQENIVTSTPLGQALFTIVSAVAQLNVLGRMILPNLDRCESCRKVSAGHRDADHPFKRDGRIPEWYGWHAARRGLGSNLYRLGVPDMVIQRILRHANVSTTATYYIKTAADDVRSAMAKLEQNVSLTTLQDTFGTLNHDSRAVPASVN